MILVVFYPSLVRWSAANLKDPLTILLFTLCTYLLIDAIDDRMAMWKYLVMAGSILLLLLFAQVFYFVLVMLGFAIMIFIKVFSLLTRNLLKAAIIVIALSSLFIAAFYLLYVDREPLTKILYMCEETQIAIARSDYAGYYFYKAGLMNALNKGVVDVSQLMAVVYINAAYFLLAPFPWQMTSFNRLQVLPQMLVWYAILVLSVFGFFRLMTGKPREAILMGTFLVIGIAINSLAEGNVGAAFRHRDAFTPMFIIIASGMASTLMSSVVSGNRGTV
jgi:hypothetical protein